MLPFSHASSKRLTLCLFVLLLVVLFASTRGL